MTDYELMIIAKAQVKEAGAKEEFKKISETLTRLKATNIKEDYWGLKPFAYPIDGMLEGFYTVFNFSLDPKQISVLKEQIALSENIFRDMLVKEGK